jgi:hypothetical protein
VSFGVFGIFLQILLISLDRFFVLRLGLIALVQRVVTQPETEMRLCQVRIQTDCLHQRQHCL